MRATCLLILVSLAAGNAHAAPCRWQDKEGWPAMVLRGDIVHFARTWVCPADAVGELEAKIYVLRGRKKVEVKSIQSKVEAKGKWTQKKKVSDRIFGYGSDGYCADEPPAKGKRVERVVDHEVSPAVALRLRAEVKGTGAMAGLGFKEEIEVYCRACKGVGSYLNLRKGRAGASTLDKEVIYSLKVNKQALACIKRGSTLELRYFLGNDQTELRNAIRPTFVEKGIERKFKTVKDQAVFEGKPPLARLCRSGKSHVAIELGGKGKLRQMDSNRRVIALRCK